MSVIRIASRYAKSLMDVAKEKNSVERVLEDVKALKEASKHRELNLMLKSPIINTGKKHQILKEIFGGKFDEMTMKFIGIIMNKGREAYIPEIADEFIAQYKAHNNMSTVTVTSATPLTQSSLEKIKTKLLASSATDKNIDFVTKVDKSILGGVIIEFDGKRYDASIARKLELLKKEFAANN